MRAVASVLRADEFTISGETLAVNTAAMRIVKNVLATWLILRLLR